MLPQDIWEMTQAYTAAQLSFRGPGHPYWRLQWVANVNWVFSLTQDMVVEARQAAIAAHGGGHQGEQNELQAAQNEPQGKHSPFSTSPACSAGLSTDMRKPAKLLSPFPLISPPHPLLPTAPPLKIQFAIVHTQESKRDSPDLT